jgi:hypothetical protein
MCILFQKYNPSREGQKLTAAYQSFIEKSCCGFPLAAFQGLTKCDWDSLLLLALLVQE